MIVLVMEPNQWIVSSVVFFCVQKNITLDSDLTWVEVARVPTLVEPAGGVLRVTGCGLRVCLGDVPWPLAGQVCAPGLEEPTAGDWPTLSQYMRMVYTCFMLIKNSASSADRDHHQWQLITAELPQELQCTCVWDGGLTIARCIIARVICNASPDTITAADIANNNWNQFGYIVIAYVARSHKQQLASRDIGTTEEVLFNVLGKRSQLQFTPMTTGLTSGQAAGIWVWSIEVHQAVPEGLAPRVRPAHYLKLSRNYVMERELPAVS
ncbi:hypothetical protein EDB19DRAFT_1835043 [Suillus lakei]|nr:hypothetical protein EDB19DRAFT_1835043 [Suillus lakei]